MRFNLAKMGYSCYSLVVPWLLAAAAAAGEPRSRVVTVHNAAATRPVKGQAYFKPQPAEVRRMVDAGVSHWTGMDTPAAGWRALVSPRDIVGIKVNAAPGPVIGTRPSVARAVVASLIDAGIPKKNIVVWDKNRDDLHRSGFFQIGRELGVEVEGSARAGYERSIHHTQALVVPLERGDLEFGEMKYSPRSHLTRLVSRRFTRIIQVSSLLYHSGAGVDGCLHGLAVGSVDNTRRFRHLKVHLDNAVPAIHRMVVQQGFLSGGDYAKRLKQAKDSIAGLVPPDVTINCKFFYEAGGGGDALPPLRALRLAFADARDKKTGAVPKVIIVSPDEKRDWQMSFHPDGGVEYMATRSKAVLHIVDALLCQFSGGNRLRLQYTAVMNELRFSADPVALDVLSLGDIGQNAGAARLNLGPLNRDICRYAALLRLGEDNPDRIKVERFSLPAVYPGKRE